MTKEKANKIAAEVLRCVGGKENISFCSHCATRLRLVLVDKSKPDTEAIKNISGVIGVVDGDAQYQVIIGQDVLDVYNEMMEQGGFNDIKAEAERPDSAAAGGKPKLSQILADVASLFTPIIPAMTAGGFIKAIMYLLQFLGIITKSSQTYIFFYNVVGDAPFYFMPFLLAYSTAKK